MAISSSWMNAYLKRRKAKKKKAHPKSTVKPKPTRSGRTTKKKPGFFRSLVGAVAGTALNGTGHFGKHIVKKIHGEDTLYESWDAEKGMPIFTKYRKAPGDEHGVIKDKHGDTYNVVKRRHNTGESSGIDKRWEIHHPRYGHVATATGTASKERPIIDTINVRSQHRRKGLASALYDHIEKHEGVKLHNNSATEAGKAFRGNRKLNEMDGAGGLGGTPTNNASSGAVAGLGQPGSSEPGVKKKTKAPMLNYKMFKRTRGVK